MSPFMLAALTMASWETVYHRTVLMAQGACTAREYERMVTEKSAAFQASFRAALTGQGQQAIVAPFLTRARANAKRLRGTS